MLKITDLVVDNIGNREPVTATRDCRSITVVEYQGTTDFIISDVVSGGVTITVPAGQPWTFNAPASNKSYIRSGVIVGYIATASGTVTFKQIEEY